jgi:hypothetical protein
MELEVELADPHGERVEVAAGAHARVVLPHVCERQPREGGERVEFPHALQHLGRRPSAAVSVADRQQALRVVVLGGVVAPGREERLP